MAGQLAITFFLQIENSASVGKARACLRVPELTYPSRTRAMLSVSQTANKRGAANAFAFLIEAAQVRAV